MRFRDVTTFVLSVVFVFGLIAGDVEAGHKSKKIAKGIAIAVGASVLAAAAASAANAHRNNESYGYHHGLGKRENAVAACVHRAEKIVRRDGGIYVQLNRVKRVDHIGGSKFRVVAKMTGVYPWGHKKSRVKCVVKHGHVRKFKYN